MYLSVLNQHKLLPLPLLFTLSRFPLSSTNFRNGRKLSSLSIVNLRGQAFTIFKRPAARLLTTLVLYEKYAGKRIAPNKCKLSYQKYITCLLLWRKRIAYFKRRKLVVTMNHQFRMTRSCRTRLHRVFRSLVYSTVSLVSSLPCQLCYYLLNM